MAKQNVYKISKQKVI